MMWQSVILTVLLAVCSAVTTTAEDYSTGQERAWLEGRWWSSQIDDDGCWRFWSDVDQRWLLRSELSSSSQKNTRQVIIQECVGDTCRQVVTTAIYNDGTWWIKYTGKWQYWRNQKWNSRKADLVVVGRPANTGRTFRRVVYSTQDCGSYG